MLAERSRSQYSHQSFRIAILRVEITIAFDIKPNLRDYRQANKSANIKVVVLGL